MIIGIDVGGTHADGVLLRGRTVAAKKKVALDHGNLEESIIVLLEALLPEDREELNRIQLSTTVCTNAIIGGTLDRVGMFVQSGPGLNPDFLDCGEDTWFLGGAIDHRGKVIRGPELTEVERAVLAMKERGIDSVGIVTKFSHRNNEHELWIKGRLAGDFRHVSLGHRISGLPNFPRRVYTTWLNSALKSQFHSFRESMEKGFARLGVSCPCYILKADGGTIPFAGGCEFPCQTIHSGPSASVMGALALVEDVGDAVMLDIGGTTTDIAIFADGVPLLEPYGETVDGRPTLVRALRTKSIGLGGDSLAVMENGNFRIGPKRKGPPMAFGGAQPTPTDAMVVLGSIEEGDWERARQAMQMLQPDHAAEQTAGRLLQHIADRIKDAVDELIDEVFSRPVYTVSAFLEREKITPKKCIIIGGPAQALADVLHRTFSVECIVPAHYEVANAIGSARARLTVEASLYGDTNQRRMTIPELSLMEDIGKMFDMKAAEARLGEAVRMMAKEMGGGDNLQVDFTERLEMNTVKGFATTGRILSLKAQIRPGLADEE